MQYEGEETVALNINEEISSEKSKKKNIHNERIKKYLLNNVMPVVVHIISLLIGLGIIMIMSSCYIEICPDETYRE